MKAQILSTAMYAPGNPVDNQFFNKKYGIDIDTFLKEKRNIYARHYMSPEQTTSDLVVKATEKALSKAKLKAEDIDLIIVATDTPDYLSPSTASVVQFKLGAKNAGTFDVNTACAGFVTALDIAWKYVKTQGHVYKNIVVAGAYGMSKYINWDDHKIASLFADGAGVIILKATEAGESDIIDSQLYADGQYHDYMGVYAGGTFMPTTHDVLEKKQHLLNFAKKIPLETNATQWPRLVNVLADRNKILVSDIKQYFFTQINIDTINASMDVLKVDRKKSHNIMDRFGYTGSACIPMALADADEKGLLKRGDLIALVGSGGGLSMAAMFLKW